MHGPTKAKAHQAVVAKVLGILNETSQVQVVVEEALARLTVVQQELVAEAAGLAAGRWIVRAELVVDEDIAVEAADSTAAVATALSVGETEQVVEVVFAAENQDEADKVAPT